MYMVNSLPVWPKACRSVTGSGCGMHMTRGAGMCGLRMRQFGVRMGKKRYAPDEVMRAVSLVAAGGMSVFDSFYF